MFQFNVSFNLGKTTDNTTKEVVVKDISENEMTFTSQKDKKGNVIFIPQPNLSAIYKLWRERGCPIVLDCTDEKNDVHYIANVANQDIYTE